MVDERYADDSKTPFEGDRCEIMSFKALEESEESFVKSVHEETRYQCQTLSDYASFDSLFEFFFKKSPDYFAKGEVFPTIDCL